MRPDGLDHLRIDAQDRIERHRRILKDHGDVVTAQLAARFLVHRDEIAAVIGDAAIGDAARRID